MKWRAAILVMDVDLSTAVNQRLHDVHVSHLAGAEERRVFEQVGGIDERLVIQQLLHC